MPFTPHSASLTSLAYRHLVNEFNESVEIGNRRNSQTLGRVSLHECVHTLLIWFMPGTELLIHVTVIPDEDGSDGATVTEAIELKTRRQQWAELVALLGGKVAERCFANEASFAGFPAIGPLSKSQNKTIRRMLRQAEEEAEVILHPRRRLLKKLAIRLFDSGTLSKIEVQRNVLDYNLTILDVAPAYEVRPRSTRANPYLSDDGEEEFDALD
ncbi:hypothetical protein niasHT_014625 [Heterodera trifolii]|uniref:Uncharacterized protein n=1 Tax=Heterodera trifolii TaxID=157864 RepID=A0ABD2LHZ4_9BILA